MKLSTSARKKKDEQLRIENDLLARRREQEDQYIESLEKIILNAPCALTATFTFTHSQFDSPVDEQMVMTAVKSFVKILANRYRYNCNIGYVYRMERRISILSTQRCFHLDVVLLANAQLDHEHIQSLWGHGEKEYRPVRPYSDAVAAHADHLRTTLSAKGMNEYLGKVRPLHRLKLKMPPRWIREVWEEENYHPSFQIGNSRVTPYAAGDITQPFSEEITDVTIQTTMERQRQDNRRRDSEGV